jgi:hypothetical protein
LEKVRVSFFLWSSHEWTSSSWNLLLIRGWFDLFVVIFLGFLFFLLLLRRGYFNLFWCNIKMIANVLCKHGVKTYHKAIEKIK